jgi:hypothetical protein
VHHPSLMAMEHPPTAEIPHLLEWHASYCVILAESTKHPRAQMLLRLLAVDLTIEAERSRRLQRQALPAIMFDETAES